MKLLQSISLGERVTSLRFHEANNWFIVFGSTRGAMYHVTVDKEASFEYSFSASNGCSFNCLSFGESQFVISGENLPLQRREVATGYIKAEFGFSSSGYSSVLLFPCSCIATQMWEDNKTDVIDLPSGQLIKTITVPIDNFEPHPEGRIIASRLQSYVCSPIVFLDAHTFLPFRDLTPGNVHCLAFRPQGDMLVTFDYIAGVSYLTAYDFPSLSILYEITRNVGEITTDYNSPLPITDRLVFSPDGEQIWLPTPSGTIAQFGALTGKIIGETQIHDVAITSIHIRPDLDLLATGDLRGNVKLWTLGMSRQRMACRVGLVDKFIATRELLSTPKCVASLNTLEPRE